MRTPSTRTTSLKNCTVHLNILKILYTDYLQLPGKNEFTERTIFLLYKKDKANLKAKEAYFGAEHTCLASDYLLGHKKYKASVTELGSSLKGCVVLIMLLNAAL